MQITACDGSQHRLDRLRKAARIATAICGLSDNQAAALIERIHDERGALHIHWLHDPTDHQRRAWSVAWEQCREHADRVEHFVAA